MIQSTSTPRCSRCLGLPPWRICPSLWWYALDRQHHVVSLSPELCVLRSCLLTVAPKKYLSLPLGTVKPTGWLSDQVMLSLVCVRNELSTHTSACILAEGAGCRTSWASTRVLQLVSCTFFMPAYLLVDPRCKVSRTVTGQEDPPLTRTWRKVITIRANEEFCHD